jgi:hypothetical protein
MISIHDIQARTGSTVKQTGIDEVIDYALEKSANAIAVISSGNYIRAIKDAVHKRELEKQLKIVNLVNTHRNPDDLEVLIEEHRLLKDAEERQAYVKEHLPDIGNVVDITDYIATSLKQEAQVILSKNPDYVALGVGTGKLYVALADIIKQQGLKTKLVGVLPNGENGIYNDDNITTDQDGKMHFKTFEPKSLADKLVTPFTHYKQRILDSLQDGHQLVEVTNTDFKRAHKAAKKHDVQAEISGSAGFILYDDKMRKQLHIPDTASITVVNTGKGVESHEYHYFSDYVNGAMAAKLATAVLVSVVGVYGLHNYNQSEELAFLRKSNLAAATHIARVINVKPNFASMTNEQIQEFILQGTQKEAQMEISVPYR